eukprot:PhM_4_TR13792/c0_g1_i1/m.74585
MILRSMLRRGGHGTVMRTPDDMLLGRRWQRLPPKWSKHSKGTFRQGQLKAGRMSQQQIAEMGRPRPSTSFEHGCTEFLTKVSQPRPRATLPLHPSDLRVREAIVCTPAAAAGAKPSGDPKLLLGISHTNTDIGTLCGLLGEALGHPGAVRPLAVHDRRALVEQYVVAPPQPPHELERVLSRLKGPLVSNTHILPPGDVPVLAEVEHTALLRNVSSYSDVATALLDVSTRGFVNYYPPGKHGVHVKHFLPFCRCILGGDVVGALENYVRLYPSTYPEIAPLWRSVRKFTSVKEFLKSRGSAKGLAKRLREAQDADRHTVMADVLDEVAKSGHHAAAANKILHRVIPKAHVRSRLAAISEITFNAMASLRIKAGPSVMPGDLVIPHEQCTHPLPGALPSDVRDSDVSTMLWRGGATPVPPEVVTADSVGRFTLRDVVLPVPSPHGPVASLQFPTGTSVNRTSYEKFLEAMAQSPLLDTGRGTYRHVVSSPIKLERCIAPTVRGNDVVVDGARNPFDWLKADDGGSVRLSTSRGILTKEEDGSYISNDNIIAVRASLPPDVCLWAMLREVVDVTPPLHLRRMAAAQTDRVALNDDDEQNSGGDDFDGDMES